MNTQPRTSDPPPWKRRTLGYLSFSVTEQQSVARWLGTADAALERGANLITLVGRNYREVKNFDEQANILYDLLTPDALDGVVVGSILKERVLCEEDIRAFYQRLSEHVVSIVPSVSGIPHVSIDDYGGMREALIHLIEVHQHRRIAFLRGPTEHPAAKERYRAYTDVLQDYQIPFDPQLVTPPSPWRVSLLEVLLDDRNLRPGRDFDAVVAASDLMKAISALTCLQSRGFHVPRDVAVVGFDDTVEGQVQAPPLTSVRKSFYEQGQQAVRLLLDRIDGQDVPDMVQVPARLVARYSCGCVDPSVKRAATGPIVARQGDTLQDALLSRQPEIVADMAQPVGASAETLARVKHVLDEFLAEMRGAAPGTFTAALNQVVSQSIGSTGEAHAWQDALSALRRAALPYIEAGTERGLAEDLWGQARVVVGEAIRREQALLHLRIERQTCMLRQLERDMATTFDVEGVMEVLACGLPQLGIPACYLALYDDPPDYAASHQVPEYARLMLAYARDADHQEERFPLEKGGRRFPARQLVPPELLPQDRPYHLLIQSLYFRDQQIGVVAFEVGPRDGDLYEALRFQISIALQGALLVKRVREHAAEISRKNAEITRQKYILETFMANVPDFIYFKDRESRFLNANQALVHRFGIHDAAELIGKSDFDFLPENLARPRYEQEQEIVRTGQPLLNLEEPDAGGRWALTTKMPLRDEHSGIVGTFGISRDITHLKNTEQELLRYRDHLEALVHERTAELTRSNTLLHDEIAERKQAEQALWVSEQQYRLLAENVVDGIVIVQDEKIVFANAAFAALFRYPVADLLGGEPATLFPEYAKHAARRKPEGPEPFWHVEIMTGDGQMIWAEMHRTSMMWDNRPAHLLTVRNITQHKLQEIRLEEERARLQQENIAFKSTNSASYRFGSLIGKSPVMQRVYELIVSAAASDVNVLVVGESGTGKELIARTLHQVSRRKDHAFVPVNCASIPETLFEREFFGHRKGAFTGADRDNPGLFDRAHKGMLFLDEVTELSPGTQAKLLRVLQDGEYTPLGGNVPKQAKVSIVAATNKDCRKEIAQGRLRKDFFYRIGVIEIDVPPLRERKEDLPLLIEHILEQYREKQREFHGSIPDDLPTDHTMLPGDFIQAIYAYDWQGNVRELQNIVQRYLVAGRLETLLPLITTSRGLDPLSKSPVPSPETKLSEILQQVEKRVIAGLLAQNRYNKRKTAKMLGISRSTLHIKIKQYQLES